MHAVRSRWILPPISRTAVADWLSEHLLFHLTLPNYPERPGEPKKYVPVGARLLQYGEDDVAYLADFVADRFVGTDCPWERYCLPVGRVDF